MRTGLRSGAHNDSVTAVIAAEGTVLEKVLDASGQTLRGGLTRQAYGRFCAALKKTPWGRRCQRRLASVEGSDVIASAEQYALSAVFEGRAVRVCGIGSVFTEMSHRGQGHARDLLETLLEEAAQAGTEMALLFLSPGSEDDAPADFQAIPLTDLTLHLAESPRHGAPMTMVRGGEERDLAAITAMGRVRASPFRFHLDRDAEFAQYAITRKRLLAGLGPPDARQLHFFIAEEGTTAAAYIVVSIAGSTWTIEECGDRDPSGARVGALLQALIAREPIERRPTILAWLPPHFLPPQVTIASAMPSKELIMVRSLDARAIAPPLATDDILYWHNDML
jgi:predicted GNAT family acetyltransferase